MLTWLCAISPLLDVYLTRDSLGRQDRFWGLSYFNFFTGDFEYDSRVYTIGCVLGSYYVSRKGPREKLKSEDCGV
jgi:hypothetical protein